MAQVSLVTEQIDAGNEFLRKFEESVGVVTAFWLKEPDEGKWTFYVASSQFNEGRLKPFYERMVQIARDMNNPSFDPFQVKFVKMNEPPVPAVLSFYETHPPTIPYHLHERLLGGVKVEEIYLVKGPTDGGYTAMPSGREVLHQIIDAEANFFQQHNQMPRKMKLPVLMAYDLAKCGRDELGDLSGKVFKDGIAAFEKEGFHGMTVEIVRSSNASLELE
jgi:hypothetical protein